MRPIVTRQETQLSRTKDKMNRSCCPANSLSLSFTTFDLSAMTKHACTTLRDDDRGNQLPERTEDAAGFQKLITVFVDDGSG